MVSAAAAAPAVAVAAAGAARAPCPAHPPAPAAAAARPADTAAGAAGPDGATHDLWQRRKLSATLGGERTCIIKAYSYGQKSLRCRHFVFVWS